MRNTLILGQWNTICDRCGFKFKASELKKDWQGLMVCEKDFELRNPQDFIRIRPERISPPWVRPESTDAFIETQGLFDTFTMLSDGMVQDYIDPTYFLEDYIGPRVVLQIGFFRDFNEPVTLTENLQLDVSSSLAETVSFTETFMASFVTEETVTDTATFTDAGEAILTDYVESGYFAELYVGSYTTF
jgi:hypothetical protein